MSMRPLVLTAILLSAPLLGADAESMDLRLKEVRESLTGSHLRYQQFTGGVEVVGAEWIVDLDFDGRVVATHRGTKEPGLVRIPRADRLRAAAAFAQRYPGIDLERIEPVVMPRDGELRPAWRITAAKSLRERFHYYLDDQTLETSSIIPLFFNGVPARVFRANPVTLLNDPTLQDQDNSAGAVPQSAYSIEELLDLPATGPLRGPHVSITELESPVTPPADLSQALSFDRSHPGFEEVMAYYHLDTSQRYLQSLGYSGSRQIVQRSLRVDAHAAAGADQSYYAITPSGEGVLYFGDGGVDDAEDPDILLHEYGHAIHEGIAPGVFFGPSGSSARALGEGFGDYWAFSSGYPASTASGRDPFCIGDWDARCADAPSTRCLYRSGDNCLRRVDSSKTMDDFNPNGSEHSNGEIWSSALRQVFVVLVARDGVEAGRRKADQLVLESMFGMPPSPTYRTAGQRMILADRLLFHGQNEEVICWAMQSRKIFGAADCKSVPRGELTFFQASDGPRAIPDNDEQGIRSRRPVTDSRIIEELQVRVDIEHPFRGDLHITLTGPNGVTATLYSPGPDPGDDLKTTFGYDSQSRDSLEVFRGISAQGSWTLHVADLAEIDVGRLLSWSLIVRFQGDAPLAERIAPQGPRKLLPAIAQAAASGTVTDVRILNSGSRDATVTLYFTPGGTDGITNFSAVQLSVAAKQNVLLSDVVQTTFRTVGGGSVEIQGEVSNLTMSSRSYRHTAAGTLGFFAEAVDSSQSVGRDGSSLHVQLRNQGPFRTTVGLSEIAGSSGFVEVLIFDSENRLVDTQLFPISAYGHLETPTLQPSAEEFAIGRTEMRVWSGEARVVGYGVMTDTASGDTMYLPASIAPATRSQRVLPAAIRADGLYGTAWRTDLLLTNLSPSSESVDLWLFPSMGTPASSISVTVPPRNSLLLPDVLQTRFGVVEGTGQLWFFPSAESLMVASRVWTTVPDGTISELVQVHEREEAIGLGDSPVESGWVEQSETFRTNIGISEINGHQATVRVRFFNAAGDQVQERDVSLPPTAQLQLNMSQLGAPPLSSGRASFEVIGGKGRILAYASVVDNRSADASYVPARKP